MTLSTTKAEYIAASMAFCEAVWLLKLFSELLYDNQRWDSIIEESCIRRLLHQIDIMVSR